MEDRLSPKTYARGPFTISTDPARMDLKVIHGYLTRSYWSPGISPEDVRRSIKHALCFGVFRGDAQVGFARVVTDYVTIAYLNDVFILEAFQGQGLGKWLIETVIAHPALQGLRRWLLATRDAHGLYAKYGFELLRNPDRFMEINALDTPREGVDRRE